ncbi:MAG TPA: CaiB/BaiF CoA-transferase family protein [Alphaproteobacteria bacterium]|mgnify:CR=1 FL=1|nr:CaiB/BaiF CoA-transferase family protein [Alphaproteobacteria bacterium]MDP6269235.1 CaiB/BaiF CoA-transferase family protein [Alphaproteobacteria bacterium]MDP7163803.1 CaiB/BaiF CoA-transferase family protein [Alphaproteobacteria bacterium]HJM49025.1 CaiB/BaiF CoA-transferase family protein [Alphaproteobacteria bacterium]
MSGPLAHIRVLDLSRILAGPWATQILADLGAEVIKVERPGQGDDTRTWGPPFLKDADGKETTDSAYYLAVNRGKKSLTLDLASPQGQDLVRQLAAKSNVLVENYKTGGLAKYGLGYEDLKALNPGLVYCSITGFGQDGPYAKRAGYDYLLQAMGGMMSITGPADGEPGAGPLRVGVALIDIITGMYSATAILAALNHLERTGEGQYIDMALMDSATALLANQGMNYLISGRSPGRSGNSHPNVAPYQPFETADGWIIVAIGNDNQFGRYCRLIGRPEMADDERFKRNQGRIENRAELIPPIEAAMRQRSSADWLAALEAEGIPGGPINELDQVFADPQVQHRGMNIELPHALAGDVPLIASPIKLSQTPVSYSHAPPTLGEHSEAVLADVLGLAADEIAELRQRGIV